MAMSTTVMKTSFPLNLKPGRAMAPARTRPDVRAPFRGRIRRKRIQPLATVDAGERAVSQRMLVSRGALRGSGDGPAPAVGCSASGPRPCCRGAPMRTSKRQARSRRPMRLARPIVAGGPRRRRGGEQQLVIVAGGRGLEPRLAAVAERGDEGVGERHQGEVDLGARRRSPRPCGRRRSAGRPRRPSSR